jgi:hypothetical protein
VSTLAVSQIEDLAGSAKVSIGGGSPALTFETSSVERFKVDDLGNISFNSGYGSSAVAYGCRAWVNFDGTGTVAIRDSGNVSSITDNGTGDYTVNFTTAMPDANYSITGAKDNISASAASEIRIPIANQTTTGANILTIQSISPFGYDENNINLAIFR